MDYHCSQFVDFEEFAEFSASSTEPSNDLAEFVPQHTYEENFEEVMAKLEGSFSGPVTLEPSASLTASAPPVIREETFEEAIAILESLSNEPEMVGPGNISSVAEPSNKQEEYFEEVMAKARALSTERPTVEPTPTVSAPKCTVKPILRIIYKESPYTKKVANNAKNKNPNTAVIKSTTTKESYSTRGGQKEESRAIIDDPTPTSASKVTLTTSPLNQITRPASEILHVTKEHVRGASTMSQRRPASNVRPIRLHSTAPRFRLAPTVSQMSLPQPNPLIKLASTVPHVGATSTVSQMVSVSTRLKSENKTLTVPQVGIMSLPPQTKLPSTMPNVKLVIAESQIKAGSMNHQIRLPSAGVTSTSQTILVKRNPNQVLSVPTGIKYVKVTSTKPQVGVMSLPTQTSLPSKMQQIKVVSAAPQLKVVSTKSHTGLESIVSQERETSMVPLLKVHSKTLHKTSTPTMSNVKVISTVPHVTVASKMPQRPSPTISHVKVTTTGPNLKNLKQPQISWTTTTLPITAKSTVTQTKVTSAPTLQSKLVPLKRKQEELNVHRPRKILVTEAAITKVAQASQTAVRNETTKKRFLTYDDLCKETLSDYVDC